MTGTDDLAAFFAARLGELEAAAAALTGGSYAGRWSVDRFGAVRDDGFEVKLFDGVVHDHATWRTVDNAKAERAQAEAKYIALNDPVAVLADVAADRQLLDVYQSADGYDLPEGVSEGRDPDERMRDEAVRDMLREVIEIRAVRFADHPDYQQTWAP